MASVYLYTFENADGAEDTFSTFDFREARSRARKYEMRVISNEYEWTSSEVVCDFTEREPVE